MSSKGQQRRGRREHAGGRAAGRARRGEGETHRETRRDLLWAAGLVALAWLHRILFLLSNRDRDWPFSVFYQGDARPFFLHARAMLEGRLYDQGVPFHPPGFPALLALLHRWLGAGAAGAEVPHFEVKLVLAGISSLSVGFLFLLVRPYLGRTVALLASALCVWHFGLYVLAVATVSEGSFLTLQLASLLLFSRALRHPLTAPGARPARGQSALWTGFVLGALFGLQALMRAESVLVGFLVGAFGLGSWALAYRAQRRRGHDSAEACRREVATRAPGAAPASAPGLADGVAWLLVAVGFFGVLAPWTLGNYERLNDFNERMGDRLAEPLPTFVPITLYGPLNLALANRDGADGSFSPELITGETGGSSLDPANPAHLRYLLHGDEMARRWISEHPGEVARLVGRKWKLYLGAFDLGFGQVDWPGGLNGVRRPVDVFVPDASIVRWPWLALAATGLVLCIALPGEGGPARRSWALLSGTVITAGFLTTALFFGYARLGLLLVPYAASFVALALVEGGARLRRRSAPARDDAPPRVLLACLGLLALVALALEIVGTRSNRNFLASASSTLDGHLLNPDDEVRLELIEE